MQYITWTNDIGSFPASKIYYFIIYVSRFSECLMLLSQSFHILGARKILFIVSEP